MGKRERERERERLKAPSPEKRRDDRNLRDRERGGAITSAGERGSPDFIESEG